jgi:tetratricopeptide (TPR) repeat protein
MEKEELLDRYEATLDEGTYLEARRLYEAALAESAGDARLLFEYGYLQECHGRNALRAAMSSYERAIELDPEWAKPRLQLIWASAALLQTDTAIGLYKQRLAAAPDDPREYRFLAYAYLVANEYEKAEQVVHAGLRLAPDDAWLVEQQGDVCAATGRPEEALAHWRRAVALDPEKLDPRYSAAFLLEREHRLGEAADEWRHIIRWLDERGYAVQAEWPKRELERLKAELESS